MKINKIILLLLIIVNSLSVFGREKYVYKKMKIKKQLFWDKGGNGSTIVLFDKDGNQYCIEQYENDTIIQRSYVKYNRNRKVYFKTDKLYYYNHIKKQLFNCDTKFFKNHTISDDSIIVTDSIKILNKEQFTFRSFFDKFCNTSFNNFSSHKYDTVITKNGYTIIDNELNLFRNYSNNNVLQSVIKTKLNQDTINDKNYTIEFFSYDKKQNLINQSVFNQLDGSEYYFRKYTYSQNKLVDVIDNIPITSALIIDSIKFKSIYDTKFEYFMLSQKVLNIFRFDSTGKHLLYLENQDLITNNSSFLKAQYDKYGNLIHFNLSKNDTNESEDHYFNYNKNNDRLMDLYIKNNKIFSNTIYSYEYW